MYEKDKRSFFEKLTGTINVDTDKDDEDVEQIIPKDEEEYEEFLEESGGQDDDAEEFDVDVTESDDNPGMIHNETFSEAEMAESEVGELGVDIFEDGDMLIVQAMIAGVRPDDIDISITRRKVKMRGTRRSVREIDEDNYLHRELYWGGFAREIKLPHEIDPERAEAIEEHGLLELRLPIVDTAATQQIQVKAI